VIQGRFGNEEQNGSAGPKMWRCGK